MVIALTEEQYFDLKVIRKHNKFAYLRVKPNRVIEVCAPVNMPHTAILELVYKKKEWIVEVSNTLGEVYQSEGMELLPISKEEEKDLKLKVEGLAFDSLERIYPFIKEYGITFPEIHIRSMYSKWGSCVVKKGRIWLNLYLVKVPAECMDYILLHLLLQFHFAKQDGDFYKALSKAMPNWKTREKFLKNIKLPQKKMIASCPKLY